VLSFAGQLPAGDRDAFLDRFASPLQTDAGESTAQRPADARGHLLADIDRFLETLADGEYVEGWGWDDDIDDDWVVVAELWVPEMEDLFEQASVAFMAGDLALAAQALGKLLHGFLLGEEVGAYTVTSRGSERVGTDLAETKARYLAALYETTPPPQRPGRLRDELSALRWIGGDLSLQAILDATPGSLSDFNAFLPAWQTSSAARQIVTASGHKLAGSFRRLSGSAAAWKVCERWPSRTAPSTQTISRYGWGL